MPKFRVADRVKTTVQAMTWNRGDIGTVTKDIGNDWYAVSLDRTGQHLISGSELELLSSVVYSIDEQDNILPVGDQLLWESEAPGYRFSPKCECGVASVGNGLHSDWCPIKNV